jgi:hypothetical protein
VIRSKENIRQLPVSEKLPNEKIKGSKLFKLDELGYVPHIEAFNRFINPFLEFLKS